MQFFKENLGPIVAGIMAMILVFLLVAVTQGCQQGKGEAATSTSTTCALDNPALSIGLERVTSTTPLPRTDTRYDELFRVFGGCLRSGPRTLAALAYYESKYQSDVRDAYGLIGLFKSKPASCRDQLRGTAFVAQCDDLTNPVVSTANATMMLRRAEDILGNKCPELPTDEYLPFLQAAYSWGHRNLNEILQETVGACDPKIFAATHTARAQRWFEKRVRDRITSSTTAVSN